MESSKSSCDCLTPDNYSEWLIANNLYFTKSKIDETWMILEKNFGIKINKSVIEISKDDLDKLKLPMGINNALKKWCTTENQILTNKNLNDNENITESSEEKELTNSEVKKNIKASDDKNKICIQWIYPRQGDKARREWKENEKKSKGIQLFGKESDPFPRVINIPSNISMVKILIKGKENEPHLLQGNEAIVSAKREAEFIDFKILETSYQEKGKKYKECTLSFNFYKKNELIKSIETNPIQVFVPQEISSLENSSKAIENGTDLMNLWSKESKMLKWKTSQKTKFESCLNNLLENRIKELNFSKLLSFSSFCIGDEGCKYLSEALKINNSLQQLNLYKSDIGAEGCKYLSEALKRNSILQQLYLGNNGFGNEGCEYLIEGLKKNNLLQVLHLENNNIGFEGCRFLSEMLKKNNSLKDLNIGWNYVRDEGCRYLSEMLKINNSLKRLNLYSNSITNKGTKYLGDALKVNFSLQELNLESNSINNRGCKYLSEALKINNSLQQLNLQRYNIQDTIYLNLIANRLAINSKNKEHQLILSKDNVDWNKIQNKKATLQILILEDCSITKLELDNFDKLKKLDLRNNQLSSEFMKSFCKFIKWNSSLKVLNLQGNKTLGDEEGEELLNALTYNICLIHCNLEGTNISKEIQERINNKLQENYPLTQATGARELNKLCSKYSEISELIISSRIEEVKKKLNNFMNDNNSLQEVLFIFCVWNNCELCKFILEHCNIKIDFQLEDGNTYLHFSVMKDNYEISKLLIDKGLNINIKNREGQLCQDLCASNGRCRTLFEKIEQLKVVILGKAQVGKTTLVKKILNIEDQESLSTQFYNFFFPASSTDGIEMHEWNIGYNSVVQLWDFGGQELFYTTHQFFLSKNSITLLLFNLNEPSSVKKELYFWLNSIQFRTPGSKVIIIGSHMDEIDPKLMEEEINMRSNKIEEIYSKVIAFSHISNSDDKIEIIRCTYWENPSLNETYRNANLSFFPISGTKGWNINHLEEIIQTFSFNTVVRKQFLALRNKIISIRNKNLLLEKNPILLREDLNSIILKYFDDKHEEIERNIKLLYELGYILDFGNNYKYIIIHPQWLSSVFKSVISLKFTKQINNGIISLGTVTKNVNDLIQLYLKEEKSKQSAPILDSISPASIKKANKPTLTDKFYEEEYKSQNEFLIELMEEFNIIIPHPNDSFIRKELRLSNKRDKYLTSDIRMIIPCLLDSEKPKKIEESIFNIKTTSKINEILGRKYHFPFIPKGVYESLFTKVCKTIGSTMHFWKNGFLITSKDTHVNLDIIIDENTNIIFIKSIGPFHSQFISSFHTIIEDLFKNDYPLLWKNVKIEIYFKKLNPLNEAEETKDLDYEECLRSFNSDQERSFNEHSGISLQKLIPEKFQEKIRGKRELLNIESSKCIVIRKLGCGSYAEVLICKYLENDGKYVMKRFKVNQGSNTNAKIKFSFDRELTIMKLLDHPNLTRLVGFESSEDNWNLFIDLFDYSLKTLQQLWLNRLPPELKKETQKNPLDDRIRKEEKYWWKEEEIIFISFQIAKGLEYLHNKLFISHLDLKLENILVDLKEKFEETRPSLFSIHIGDFGVSRQFESLDSTFSEFVGSPHHMAPEVNENQNLNNIPYNPFKADIYSLGVLFCEIVGNDPSLRFKLDKFQGKTKLEGIIRNCLKGNPTKRNDISKIKSELEEMNTLIE